MCSHPYLYPLKPLLDAEKYCRGAVRPVVRRPTAHRSCVSDFH
jgi:hypothetical protein